MARNPALESAVQRVRENFGLDALRRMYTDRTHDKIFENIGRLATNKRMRTDADYVNLGFEIVAGCRTPDPNGAGNSL